LSFSEGTPGTVGGTEAAWLLLAVTETNGEQEAVWGVTDFVHFPGVPEAKPLSISRSSFEFQQHSGGLFV